MSPERTGTFTSAIVATGAGQRIALFFTGPKHAGENLAAVLARRAAELGPPIQVCDALARNLPKPLEVILGHCLAHARRRFVDVTPNFPAECRHVLEALGGSVPHDEVAREQHLTPEDRLRFHQSAERPDHDGAARLAHRATGGAAGRAQLRAREGDHVSAEALGAELTLFLREPRAPLDNNLCERALRKAVLHRKNALFYKTDNGARVGDLFMSFIHTCELCGANPFEYLTELQRHAAELAQAPAQWLPWNYRETLASAAGSGSEQACSLIDHPHPVISPSGPPMPPNLRRDGATTHHYRKLTVFPGAATPSQAAAASPRTDFYVRKGGPKACRRTR